MSHSSPPSVASRPSLTSGLAFVLGVSLSVMPAIGPFAAVLFVFSRLWTPVRSDSLWGVAALAYALPSGLRGDVGGMLTDLGTVIGPWIVFRTFRELRRLNSAQRVGQPMAWGLVFGYAVIVALGLTASLTAFRPDEALTVLSAFAWERSPAMYGHVVLIVGALIAMSTRGHPRVAFGALGLAALGVLVSGSLEAAIAWIVMALGITLLRTSRSVWLRLAEATAVATIALVAILLAPSLGWGRIGFVLAGDAVQPTANLLAGTELPRGDWWDDHWVAVRSEPVQLGGEELTAYEVTKLGSEHWYRLQQRVVLSSGTPYTLSGWIDTAALQSEGVVPGFQGYGRRDPGPSSSDRSATPDAGGEPLVLDGRWRSGEWHASILGPGRIVDQGVLARDGTWRRVSVTLVVESDTGSIPWYVGFTPNAQAAPGGTSRVAGMMLEASPSAGPYTPGSAASGLTFGYARAPLWSAAWEAIAERPWLGWGEQSFATTYASTRPGIERQELVPAHPHNLLLAALYDRGLVGTIGLTLLLVALFGPAVRRRDAALLVVATGLAVLNTFDATLLAGGVLYPLAAAAGWRSAERVASSEHRRTGTRSVLARLSLAAADIAAALAGLGLAYAIASATGAGFTWTTTLTYAAFVWPALSWREGLFPGYGLTPAQELKKQVSAWFLAAVVVTLGVLLFPAAFGLPLEALGLWLAITLVTMTIARPLVKRGLHAIAQWGRPVLVLGAGRTGQRIVRSLKRTPMDGLHPVAFFDDDLSLIGAAVDGLPVLGPLDSAPAFAEQEGVRHAIVAIPSLEWGRLDGLISGHGRVFRHVQFIPRLGSLPTEDVAASDLDGMLALEVRNGLYAPVNRLTKRTADLVMTVAGGVVVAPVLVLLWLLVRLDSRGGGFHLSERVGQGGRPFACWKFRTMYVDAEERLEQLLHEDPKLREEYDRWHKLDDDPRVTRLGRLLRRTSLDELPQIWNVLRGEMSLVGPRPYLRREVPDVGRYADIVFQAKPGITGHWQVTARNSVTFQDRLEMEAHYVRNWSIWWDVILLFQTPLVVLSGKGGAK